MNWLTILIKLRSAAWAAFVCVCSFGPHPDVWLAGIALAGWIGDLFFDRSSDQAFQHQWEKRDLERAQVLADIRCKEQWGNVGNALAYAITEFASQRKHRRKMSRRFRLPPDPPRTPPTPRLQ